MNIRRNGRTASFKLLRSLTLFSVPLVVTCLLTQKTSVDKESTLQGQSLEIMFSSFSPAYAAFEDEFLFNKDLTPVELNAGINNHLTLIQEQQKLEALQATLSQESNNEVQTSEQEPSFRGLASFAINTTSTKQQISNLKVLDSTLKDTSKNPEETFKPEFKLNFGPMIASADIDTKPVLAHGSQTKSTHSSNPSKDDSPSLEENAAKSKSYNISGSIELKDGLAFIGSMEVSWVVDDQEIKIGAINTPDATYEINTNELIGDIIISLYDSNDELIGEGIANLDKAYEEQLNNLNINIRPIDWDKAGEIIHVHSINSHSRPVEDAEVQLYAYNDSTKTNAKGEIRFIDWKKSNSRTLALASKKGFKDSLFLIDSKKISKTLLFSNEYVDAFFSWIKSFGVYDVEDKGTVYGVIVSGNKSQEGYSVRLEKNLPIYFKNYLATNTLGATGNNGLFAFTGLSDGDYELFIEKDGIIIDRRIVPVEQGKISPLFIDIKRKKKRLEFFDPLDLEVKPSEVAVQFFDGEESLDIDENAQVTRNIVGGGDPGLIDYAGKSGVVSSTFISRQRGFAKVALLNQEILSPLLKSKNFDESNGLAIGYIKSEVTYEVSLAESVAENIIYFNSLGKEINPQEEPAYGFIISGFPQGLYTLSIKSIEEDMIVMTDLIFNDHQSISVVNSSLETL